MVLPPFRIVNPSKKGIGVRIVFEPEFNALLVCPLAGSG
jgi:hypothetical protein